MKGAIFDLDGTIADSVGVWKKVDDKVLGRYGIKVDEKYRQAINTVSINSAVCIFIIRYPRSENNSQCVLLTSFRQSVLKCSPPALTPPSHY